MQANCMTSCHDHESICLQNSNLDSGASMDPVAQPASAVGKVLEQCCHSRASTNTGPILCDQTRWTKPPNAKDSTKPVYPHALRSLVSSHLAVAWASTWRRGGFRRQRLCCHWTGRVHTRWLHNRWWHRHFLGSYVSAQLVPSAPGKES